MKKKPRIGFIIGKDGEDLIKNSKKFPEVPQYFNDNAEYPLRWGTQKKIDVDVAIPYWIKKHYDVEIDIIEPSQITPKRLRNNDINFCIGFDVITGKWLKWQYPELEDQVRNIFKDSTVNRIYPSWKLQNFVYRKGPYLKKFEKAGIPIAPTFLLRSTGTFDLARAGRILAKIKRHGWDKFVIKPELGAGSVGFEMMITKNTTEKKLLTYLNKYRQEFPGFMVQQAMQGFYKFWELRLWWYNGKFAYAIANKAKVVTGTKEKIAKVPPKDIVEQCKKIGKRIFPLLPKIKYNGKNYPPVMIRTDFGCCQGNTLNKNKYFLNEFELQAANYFTRHTTFPVVEKGSKAFVKTFQQVTNTKLRKK